MKKKVLVRRYKRRTKSGVVDVREHTRGYYTNKYDKKEEEEIIKNILYQIGANELKMAGFKLMKLNDYIGVRVHKGKKNLDIIYDYESDTYTVLEHTIKPDLSVETKKYTDVYSDQLKYFISKFFDFEYVGKLNVTFLR